MGRGRIGCLMVAATACACSWAPSASADGPVGADPSSNYSPGVLTASCELDPSSAACIAAAVQDLDQARANLGQPPYQVPANFVSLTPEEQVFVLTNLDRIQYGLPPIPGLTDALGRDAAGGVQADNDPTTSDPAIAAYTSNWAGGFANMPLAYEAWMYDDGPGSGNVDCTPSSPSGCWSHRHDILWDFGTGGPLAMGAAAGADPQGTQGYAMLLAQGDSTYHPAYTYTWNQAVASGAGSGQLLTLQGGNSSGTRQGTFKLVSLRVRKHRISFRVSASPGLSLQSSLIRRGTRGWGTDKFHACNTSKVFSRLRRGRYRLRIRAVGGATITRYVAVH